ncbi:MAG: hypothetical protein EOM03_13350 [Clostridia bacterium]|nr:hypothetical protein [Clostridia bacterium]NCC85096.1 hypothetical protein [Clostridia bacterium]
MNNTLNPQDLVDIRDVLVDKDLPKQDRVAEFVRQIKDPYHFRCGKFVVTARFAEDGPTLEECLQRIIA